MELIKFGNKLCGAVESRIGGREENQDSYVFSEGRAGLFVAVCDGMGGGPAGKTASEMACAVMNNVVKKAKPGFTAKQLLKYAVDMANGKLYTMAGNSPELRGMGTTCACIILSKSLKVTVAHVGDSRCILIRNGKIIWRTSDHSYVGELVRSGQMTAEEARQSSYSNVITRALGIKKDVEPEISTFEVHPGDRIALMSDGIWGMVPEEMMVRRLSSNDAPAEIVGNIEDNIDTLGHDNGGKHDNMTLVLIDIPMPSASGEDTIDDEISPLPEYKPKQPSHQQPLGSGMIRQPIPQAPSQGVPVTPPAGPVRREDVKRQATQANNPKQEKKKGGKGILWAIIILLVIACGGTWGYLYFSKSVEGKEEKKELRGEVDYALEEGDDILDDDSKKSDESGYEKSEVLKKNEDAILNSMSPNGLLGEASNKLNELKTYDPDKYEERKRGERIKARKELRGKSAQCLEYAAKKNDAEDKKAKIEQLREKILNDNTICNGIDKKYGRSTKDTEKTIDAYITQINSLKTRE